jgi:pilus retraction protein PilT
MLERFKKLVKACSEKGFSDIHIAGGMPLVCRKNNQIFFQKEQVFRPQEVDRLAEELLSDRQKLLLKVNWTIDFAASIAGIRLRFNVFASSYGLSMAVRFLPGVVPTIDLLNLHPSLIDMAHKDRGLVLICGPTGSGKTSTIAAMLEEINATRQQHIVTLENPIEYRFDSNFCFIEQRELGTHFHSFQQGLVDVLRQAPDVIVVGEVRDPGTIRLTLDAAESGHLVITTMHAATPEEAVFRICNSFPLDAQEFVRYQLAATLNAVIIQRLRYEDKLGFMIPHLSILRGTLALRNMIRENKLTLIDSYLETTKHDGQYSFERYEEDFIAPKKRWHTPGEIFKARPTHMSRRQEHLSELIDYYADLSESPAARAVAKMQSAVERGAEASRMRNGQEAPEPDNRTAFTIGDDESSLDDYIRMLEKRSQV